MGVETPATRLVVFLTEDDRIGRRCTAEVLLERAREAGLAGATILQAVEGFGRGGRLRAARLPDLARGLPLLLEVVDDDSRVEAFLPVVREVAPGALVTLDPVEVDRPGPGAAG